LNEWVGWQYLHNMGGAVVTAAFVMASVGAYYLLANRDAAYGKTFLRVGVIAGIVASVLVVFPSGDGQGKNIATFQPVTLAGMEGLFETKQGAALVLLGQPDMEKLRLDNPLHVPNLLSFLTYYRWKAEMRGLDSFPKEQWPTNIPLLYYSYHIMVGLGTIFIAIMVVSTILLWKKSLFLSRPFLWVLMLSFPFPFIANTAGWMTAELGRQPWLVYGLFRTQDGTSAMVSAGSGLFTLLGFLGLYFVIGVLFLILVIRTIGHGPEYAKAGSSDLSHA
jgi:cytochrome d ubiquinol oxidase subunit I